MERRSTIEGGWKRQTTRGSQADMALSEGEKRPAALSWKGSRREPEEEKELGAIGWVRGEYRTGT